MKHLSEDELVEMYYGESAAAVSAHTRGCRECSARFAELQKDLDAMGSAPAAERGGDYGERVWRSLRPQLTPYERKPPVWRAWGQWRAALAALGCVALVAGAFVGGRYWERMTMQKIALTQSASSKTTQRVVLVVLADHLDRSERLLIALEHADGADHAENEQLQSDARQLLASNRLYRVSASHADDPLLSGALDQLEGVLVEVANDPTLTATDLLRVRQEMNAEGILFQIRVLMARRPDAASGENHRKGASI